MATITHGFKDTQKAIENRLQTMYSTTPIKFEDVNFRETGSAYVALTILMGDGQRIALGDENPETRFPGVIMIQCFVPEGTSTLPALELADEIAAIFHESRFSLGNSGTIRCRTSSVEKQPTRDGWTQANVTTPFVRDRQS